MRSSLLLPAVLAHTAGIRHRPGAGAAIQSAPQTETEVLWAFRLTNLPAGLHTHFPGRVGGPFSTHHHYSGGKRGQASNTWL